MLFPKNPGGTLAAVLFFPAAFCPAGTDREGNRLAGEKSPYLLQHKDQPVDWQPWGEEAFARARRENKPVFLSIGYAACHWCHVMARESFADPKIAALLNEHFINVKVDREERPDIDRVYMAFVQASTGSGGWPLNVWLTPEGEPFFGGLYYPPEERHGLPAFATVAEGVAGKWKQEEAAIRTQGARVLAALQKKPSPAKLSDQAPERAYEALVRGYDAENGGFGGAPKFPATGPFPFLLGLQEANPEAPASHAAREMTLTSLKKIAAGGIRDHLGGGFHRYAVDSAWRVPHFEKMLSDQALLALAFLEAWQVTGDPFFADLTRETLDFVLREMALPGGGFASSLAAESATADGVAEGASYVWTEEEIDRALGGWDAVIFKARYGVEPGGNVPEDLDPAGQLRRQNVLFEKKTLAEIAGLLRTDEKEVAASLARSRATLLARRATRQKPPPDDKVVTAWNALMISALARAGAALDVPRYREAARRTAEFLHRELADSATGTLWRSWRESRSDIPAFAEDHAFFTQALLDLYETTADPQALRQAGAWQKAQDALFWDDAGGGYFDTPAGDPSLKVRLKNDRDGAEPAANSVSARNLVRLARLRHEDEPERRAHRIFQAFAATLHRDPASLPVLLAARQMAMAPPRQAVIAGDPRQPETQALVRTVLGTFAPGLAILYARNPPPGLGPDAAAALAAMTPINGKPALYFCENFICRPPVTDPGAIPLLLKP